MAERQPAAKRAARDAKPGRRDRGERRVSAPLVLAAASAMLAVAVVVWIGARPDRPAEAAPARVPLTVDDSTPERAAESFYDAWRKRRWPQALEVSVGPAREQVLQKQARDAALPREDRIVAERMWDALARAPLTFVLDESEMPEGDHLFILRGTAEYEFVNRPYRRRVQFTVVRVGERYRVREMALGEVLTELPAIFAGAEEEERP